MTDSGFEINDNLFRHRRLHATISLHNPSSPKSVLEILVCLTPDDFTRQRETP